MNRITLRDIADKTGFVHSTVSLALRDSPLVKPQTKRLIVEAARKLGYTPHPLISALMQSRRTRMTSGFRAQLGFLRFHAESVLSRQGTTDRILAGATTLARQFGYHLDLIWADKSNISHERLSRILEARGVHGIIIAPASQDCRDLVLPWERFACVSLNLGKPPQMDFVGHNYFDGMALAIKECVKLRCRRIGIALPRWQNALMTEQYLMPFRASANTLPAARRVPPILYPNDPEDAISSWISRYKPDVIVSPIDVEKGPAFIRRVVPDETVFISLNATPGGGSSGVDQNSYVIGQVATEQLIAKLNRNERGLTRHAHLTYVYGDWLSPDAAPPRPPADS